MIPVVLGIAGGSGSGKTTVARAVLESVGRHRISFLEQDSYYRDHAWKNLDEARQFNFDHPDAFDYELIVEHVLTLKAGRSIEVPEYDFVHHRRKEETSTVQARSVILLEGILLLADARLRELLDFKIYVDTDADLRLIRRLGRDINERGRSVDAVLEQYEKTVRPMHLEFVEPSKRYADIIIPRGGENRVALAMVVARIEQLLAL